MKGRMNTTYWFARGYYDGRNNGVSDDALRELIDDDAWQSYARGYDCGVSDYCIHDIGEAAAEAEADRGVAEAETAKAEA